MATHPTSDYPAALDPAATAVEVMLYKQATDMHMAYCVATTRLATALVDSVGETNKTYLKTFFCWNLPVRPSPAPSD